MWQGDIMTGAKKPKAPEDVGGLDRFLEFGPALAPPPAKAEPGPVKKVTRKSKTDHERDRRIKVIDKEIKRGGSTINIRNCFLTDLRVSAEVIEEIRIRTIHELEAYARRAEDSARRKSRKTVIMEDVI